MWEHVETDQPFSSISCGPFRQVWATGKKGCAYFRLGITQENLKGDKWVTVEPPNGGQLKQISVNIMGVWAVDNKGQLHVRKEITATFPEGTHWQTIAADPPILSRLNWIFCLKITVCKFLDSAPNTTGFKHVSVGKTQVWATTNGGVMVRREGICSANPAGSGWDIGIAVSLFC